MPNTPTPHNSANVGDFAKTVLMPGDPLRAKFIAETFLDDAKLVNNVRGVQGYTGTYKGVPVSVMASGMGMPSIAIYAYELFNFYEVENIIRVGSAGGISDDVKLRDIVIATTAITNANYNEIAGFQEDFVPHASEKLVSAAERVSKELGMEIKEGEVFSSQVFYNETEGMFPETTLAVEMEAYALYLEAERADKHALTICTISDVPSTGESLDSEARQNSFTAMMEIALNIAREN